MKTDSKSNRLAQTENGGSRGKTVAFLVLLILLILLGVSADITFGQACSCGGAPLMGSLELPATSAGRWQFGLTYEYHSIADVVSITKKLDDNTRRRSVNSALMEISYGISNRFTASALISFLQQQRATTSPIGTGEVLQTRGVGDGLFLLKYNLVPFNVLSQRQVTIGGGVKAPFGRSSLTANNLLISADMQPGTGTWDGILWGYFYQGFFNLAPIGLQATASYRNSGNNDRFGSTGDSYRFGNEFIATGGLGHSPISLFDYTLMLRYRSVTADEFNDVALPNSGGKWLNAVPGVNLNFSRAVSLRVSGQIPLYRRLEGTQLTTSYSLAVSVYFTPLGAQEDFGL
jgi:hypothetical protein